MEVSTLFKIDNNPKVVALASILAVALVATVTARPPADRHETNAATLSVDNTTYVNANNILMFVTNHGNFGRDLSDYFGNDYGTYFPFSHEGDISSGANVLSVLYAGGLWLGGVDAATGDTLVVISDYSSEYVPGPMAGGTYQSDRPEYRVYKLYGDSLAGNPNQDYLNWPTDQGAPVNGPGFALSDSDQATWCVYNDANPSQHSIMQTDPIGVEIHQTVSAGDVSSGPAASSVFLTYKIINKGGKRLNDFMISLWLDPDVGGSSDDMVGCDILDNVFYCYNATNNDQYYSMYPPAVGVKLLEGPVVPSPGKTGTVGGVPIADHRNLGLYSIVYYTNGTDPDNYEETYQYMHGLQASRAGAPPYQYMGHSTRFWLSGDPVAGTGDLDPSGDDKRIMGTLEPFDFLPGDTQQVTFV